MKNALRKKKKTLRQIFFVVFVSYYLYIQQKEYDKQIHDR